MAYEFSIGRFRNGQGIDSALVAIAKPLKGAALLQVATLERAFTEGGHAKHGGEAWAPWSPAYAKDRARKGRTQILVDRGILRRSLTYSVEDIQGRSGVVIGSNVSYGAVHQRGYQGPRAASTAIVTRARGKWTVTKSGKNKGKMVFRKGRKLKEPRFVKRKGGSMNIPARPFVVMTDQDTEVFAGRVRTWARESIVGKGAADGA